ncbi:MAG: helix-turn-helix domain-containing protein [Elusimicrobiota bacterium]
MPGPKPIPIRIGMPDRLLLGRMQKGTLTYKLRDAKRADAIFRAADGQSNAHIARVLGISRTTVKLWRKRFAEKGFRGLLDRPIPGRPPKNPQAKRKKAAKRRARGRNHIKLLADLWGV